MPSGAGRRHGRGSVMTRSRILVGLLLTVAGAVLVLDRIGGVERAAELLKQWWPLAIVCVGATNLLRMVQRPWSFWGPVLVMAVGSALLLLTVEPTPQAAKEATEFFWPLVLVAAGVAIALVGVEREDGQEYFLRQSAILRERRFTSDAKSLRHGRARAFLGHLELDLREAKFRDPRADLDVTAVCGHVDILVPRGYKVDLKPPVGLAVRAIEPPPAPVAGTEGARLLTVRVFALFGRASLKQV
jgi:hypothetical protein